ncbi:hypothetical protein DAPPUDRAFT_248189 [Daphnia pulex]|uniref:Uncharacterized protein n=1 Tax=Daphnia pulex TaxID=6669 RepID=E9GTW1_DAPPU|nr:hypothetical protein DAPPUDRAFT_248189 [Daphnia pulex]|eukprot:EFX76923.1 hypothetical protein DAPPUDRAFT_248189 [Daphnia pulex]
MGSVFDCTQALEISSTPPQGRLDWDHWTWISFQLLVCSHRPFIGGIDAYSAAPDGEMVTTIRSQLLVVVKPNLKKVSNSSHCLAICRSSSPRQ